MQNSIHEPDEDLVVSSEGLNNNLKKKKLEEVQSTPDAKLPRKSPSIRVQVVRKTKVNAKSENKPEESSVLQSLCQNYDNDVWWWAVNQARLLTQAIYWRLFLKFLAAKTHESGSYFAWSFWEYFADSFIWRVNIYRF